MTHSKSTGNSIVPRGITNSRVIFNSECIRGVSNSQQSLLAQALWQNNRVQIQPETQKLTTNIPRPSGFVTAPEASPSVLTVTKHVPVTLEM